MSDLENYRRYSDFIKDEKFNAEQREFPADIRIVDPVLINTRSYRRFDYKFLALVLPSRLLLASPVHSRKYLNYIKGALEIYAIAPINT